MSVDRNSLFSLEGKTALLTGASGFLGRTFAETLLTNGARVIALSRSERLEGQAAAWAERFGAERIRAVRIDMYDLDALGKVLDRLVGEEQHLDILVNNAHELGTQTGFNTPSGSLENSSHDQWMRNLTGGVYWAALTVQKIGQRMVAAESGSIINIATMYAVVAPNPRLYEGTSFSNPPGYSASKGALLSFTRYIASYWGSFGVRANAILPGPFANTEDASPNAVRQGDEFIERLKARTCLGRIGRPNELAGALLFLASGASSYVTGQGLVVDGGWTTT